MMYDCQTFLQKICSQKNIIFSDVVYWNGIKFLIDVEQDIYDNEDEIYFVATIWNTYIEDRTHIYCWNLDEIRKEINKYFAKL